MTAPRKRSWAAIGLSLLLIESTNADAAAAAAVTSRQHHVPAARRNVSYAHVLQGRSRAEAFEAFYKPPKTAEQQQSRRRTTTSKYAVDAWKEEAGDADADSDHHYWHLAVDASSEHPDLVFRQLRETQTTPQPASWETTMKGFLRRSLQVYDKFTVDNTVIAPRDGVTAAHIGIGAADLKTATTNNISSIAGDYNVTAETAYNVSATVGKDLGNQINDTGTAVFTQSALANATVAAAAGTGGETDNEERVVYQPLRIRAVLAEKEGGGEHLTDEQRNSFLQDMIRPALLVWSAALRVEPVVGNLTVDEAQLADSVSCGPGLETGLPSIIVPFLHFDEGIPDTDVIIYLSLGFVESENATASNITAVDAVLKGVSNFTRAVNTTLQSNTTASTGLTTERNTSGIPKRLGTGETPVQANETLDVDPVLLLANQTSNGNETKRMGVKHRCAGDYLAASSFCSSDQYDRPTAAILHICVGESFFEPESLQTNIMTIMHELGHALGFNAHSMARFRKPDGSPITSRVDGEVPVTNMVECTGTQFSRTYANATLPSPEILQFRTVRGGVRVAEIVTPSVRQAVRNHFDCQQLPGAELESGESLPLSTSAGEVSCLGDHWERRLFKNDLMNPIVDGLEFNPRISTLTLAYFADSGWYQVDLSRTALSASWGRGAGCAFVEENCIGDDGQVPTSYEPYFCNEHPGIDAEGFATEINGCTPDLTRKAACSIGKYVSELPVEYQYFNFTYGANVGGSDAFMDYCPVFSGFSNGLCSDEKNEALIRVNQMEKIGGRNSRCLAGYGNGIEKFALCLPIACVVEDRSLRVQIDGHWRVCNFKDEVLVSRSGDHVICPNPIRVCPTFYCDRDCLGTSGWCNYTKGQCMCNATVVEPLTDTISTEVFLDSYQCEQEVEEESGSAIFYHPPATGNDLPDADSPLADYYVSTARVLRDQPDQFRGPWRIFFEVSGGVLLVLFVVFLIWLSRRPGREQDNWLEPGTDGAGNASTNPNKDKMMATVVVDMRMNRSAGLLQGARDVLQERASETDISMTDTEGSRARASSAGSEPLEPECLQPVDSIDAPSGTTPMIRRRFR